MTNLVEIALRRLDGAYFGPITDADLPTDIERYGIMLYGFDFTPEAEAAFTAATKESRELLSDELRAKMPSSMRKSSNRKLKKITEASDLSSKGSEKVLKLVTEGDLAELYRRLVSQPLPYSVQDLLDLEVFGERFYTEGLRATTRENNATLAVLLPEYDWTQSMTVTDGLRVASAWSGGDVTLATSTRFKLKRSQRRALALALEEVLEKSDYAYFDFPRHAEKWKRLFTALHVSDYCVPKLQTAADMLFNGQLSSIDSLIEFLIKEGDFDGLMGHFRTMPGIFARRLQELLRKMPNRRDEIVAEFEKLAPRVSTRVLVQVRNYFNGPSRSEVPNRPFAGKSRTARNGLLENRKPDDCEDVVAAVDSALSTKLQGTKVYMGEGGSKISVMTSNRSAAIGSRAMASGSRIAIGEDPDFITLFTHWKDTENSRVDLDVSALFLSEDLLNSEQLAYYSTHSEHARYSGDITSAPEGAEEYITVDVKRAQKRGFRYMAIVVNSFTGQSISTIPECYAGVAVSDSLDFRNFKASDVELRFDLAADGREIIPLVVDLETMEMIWVDMAFKGASSGARMDASTSLASVLKFIVHNSNLTVGELIQKSGAVLVDSPEKADISVDPRMSDQVVQLLA